MLHCSFKNVKCPNWPWQPLYPFLAKIGSYNIIVLNDKIHATVRGLQ